MSRIKHLCFLISLFTSTIQAQIISSDGSGSSSTSAGSVDVSSSSTRGFSATDASTASASIIETASVIITTTSPTGTSSPSSESAVASSVPTGSANITSNIGAEVESEPDYALPAGYQTQDPSIYTDNNLPPARKNHGNPSPVVLSVNESINLAEMEGQLFTYFAENEPAPGVAPIKIPEVTCATTSSGLTKRAKAKCKTYKTINIDVYFHYVWNGKATRKSKADWEARVKVQMAFVKSVFDPFGIIFKYVPSIEYLKGPFSDNVLEDEKSRLKVLNKFHMGGNDDLNVFLVESITSTAEKDPTIRYNGYSNLLTSEDLNGDGIVMDQARLGNEAQNTLVHEIGHWLGLEHTFGDAGSLCTLDDGLLDTTRTSGARATIYSCFQKPCDSETEARINNWMSYSECAGTDIGGTLSKSAFTTDQKARMFARFLKYRLSISNACSKDPSPPKRRSLEYEDWRRSVNTQTKTLHLDESLYTRSQGGALIPRQQNTITPPESMSNLRDGTCPKPGAPIPGTVHASSHIGSEDTKGPDTGSGGVTAVATGTATAKATGTGSAAGSTGTNGATAAVSRNISLGSLALALIVLVGL